MVNVVTYFDVTLLDCAMMYYAGTVFGTLNEY